MELTYDEIMELKYEARHGDEYAERVLDEYYGQFEEIPDPMTAEEELEYKKSLIEEDTIFWLNQFADDYYGVDGRYFYPRYEWCY